jgi:hypothetical protein
VPLRVVAAIVLPLALGFSILGSSLAAPVVAPQGLSLTAGPPIVDVGGDVGLKVTATRWTGPASVSVTFLSPHHGFSGKMVFASQCNCFRLNVFLAKRSHALETARVTARVTVRKQTFVLRNAFEVRGLTANGKTFSPGGTPHLAGWVSDPQPVQNEFVHFCAWTQASDAFPIHGVPVTFVVHYQKRTQKWFAGLTGSNGVLCSSKDIYHAKIGFAAAVDIYAGRLHERTSFTPRTP